MKKIIFINPSYTDNVLRNVKSLSQPPMSLAFLAGHTPDQYEMEIIDEQVSKSIDYTKVGADLVAISGMTCTAPRAYEISAQFRSQGIPVIMGGIHASMRSEEASQFVDAVVVGEGEEIWPEVIKDFEKNQLKKIYTANYTNLEHVRKPRKDLFSNNYLATPTVQYSRGCPFGCNFCSVTRFNGGTYRFRKVEDVISEISQMETKHFGFVDDNVIGSGERSIKQAFRLFEQLKDLGKKWGSQISINIAENDKLLKMAAKSGAEWFFIGFESIEKETLEAMNKRINLHTGPGNYKDVIKKIHDAGVAVAGGFIFGGDNDTKDVFERTVEFIHNAELDIAQFFIQTPFPGTKLHEQLDKENRILVKNYPQDWKRYNGYDVVFKPKNMTEKELKDGLAYSYKMTASLGTSVKRAMKTLFTTRNWFATLVSFYWNHDSYEAFSKL